MIGHDIIEELSTLGIFHDEVELLWRLNNFIKLNYIRMSYHLQYMNFSCYSLNIIYVLNFVLFKNFNGNFFTSEVVNSKFNFTKCSFSNGFAEDILSHIGACLINWCFLEVTFLLRLLWRGCFLLICHGYDYQLIYSTFFHKFLI